MSNVSPSSEILNMPFESDIVVLDRGEYTTCSVNLHGANVTSWRIYNKEQLFVSRLSKYQEQNFIRGGTVVVFPRHSTWEFGPEHGFSRLLRWTVEKPPKKLPSDDIEATFSVEDNDYTRSMWNYKFKITNKITLRETELAFDVSVKNIDKNFSFNFEIMMYTHIRVPDVTKCKVFGLSGCNYKEIAFANPEKLTQEDEMVEFAEYINRCYENTPNEVMITDIMLGKNIRLRKKNFPELVIWNPWEEHGKEMEQFDPNDYMKMITVEASHINNAIRLAPGEEYIGKLELEVCDPE